MAGWARSLLKCLGSLRDYFGVPDEVTAFQLVHGAPTSKYIDIVMLHFQLVEPVRTDTEMEGRLTAEWMNIMGLTCKIMRFPLTPQIDIFLQGEKKGSTPTKFHVH